MKRNIYKNVKVAFFTLFVLIIIFVLKSNFFKNLTNILKFDESKRIEKNLTPTAWVSKES